MRSLFTLLPHLPQREWLRSHTYNTNGQSEAANANALIEAWRAASAQERVALGAAVGVNEVWDSAIAPLI